MASCRFVAEITRPKRSATFKHVCGYDTNTPKRCEGGELSTKRQRRLSRKIEIVSTSTMFEEHKCRTIPPPSSSLYALLAIPLSKPTYVNSTTPLSSFHWIQPCHHTCLGPTNDEIRRRTFAASEPKEPGRSFKVFFPQKSKEEQRDERE